MANTYEVKITNLERTVEVGDLDDVIFRIHFSYNATDNESTQTKGALHNFVNLAAPESDGFVAFGEVTEAKCIAWVLSALADQDPPTTEADMKAKVDAQITRKKAPVEVTGVPSNWS
jgi:hypothetical protein|tara:strand:- start:197 stop:547 length:351 start_codon:yes stop_codon:yes gene_type:complete